MTAQQCPPCCWHKSWTEFSNKSKRARYTHLLTLLPGPHFLCEFPQYVVQQPAQYRTTPASAAQWHKYPSIHRTPDSYVPCMTIGRAPISPHKKGIQLISTSSAAKFSFLAVSIHFLSLLGNSGDRPADRNFSVYLDQDYQLSKSLNRRTYNATSFL